MNRQKATQEILEKSALYRMNRVDGVLTGFNYTELLLGANNLVTSVTVLRPRL